MATKKKLLQAAAGNAGGAALDITDVFSTYLYTGNGTGQTITNGIDLAGEGGLVWSKARSSASAHFLQHKTSHYLSSNTTAAEIADARLVTQFNSDGYNLGIYGGVNGNGDSMASWTFRKAPKFFDVVTYTGDGTSGRTISHNLGSVPGAVIWKRTSSTSDWWVNHRGVPPTANVALKLNTTDSATALNIISSVDGEFVWDSNTITLNGNAFNSSGETFVLYLFAHNDGDGEFGPDSDQDIIKCGSFTTDGSGLATVDLGFEPQFLIRRMISGGNTWNRNWDMYDIMRGITMNNDYALEANTSDAEASMGNQQNLTPTGFTVHESTANQTFIYIAIRRGPLAQPESGTEVFAMDTLGGTSPTPPGFNSGFTVDMAFLKPKTSNSDWLLASRLIQGKQLVTNSTVAEVNETANVFDYMNGYYDFPFSDSNYQAWMWKRAPGFFDVVAYKGDGVAGRTVSHNLGVAPEMMWVKRRDSSGYDWNVYVSNQSNVGYLNSANGFIYSQIVTATANSSFTLNNDIQGNASGGTYIAYLFATLPGVSKVGSYTGNGSSQTIDCGFTSGARFVLIKKTSNTGHWIVFDTVRGIVSGIDPFLKLNNTDAENTGHDAIDPNSSGFIINESGGAFNVNNETYIFYAIA